MLALEILQTSPSQRRALLSPLGVVDPNPFTVVIFETHKVQACFPYHVYFFVHVDVMNNMIKHIVVDEGVVASVMSLDCCKGHSSPTLLKYMTMLTAFDGHSFSRMVLFPLSKSSWEGRLCRSRSRWLMYPLTTTFYWVVIGFTI